jgi:hypothetical protein
MNFYQCIKTEELSFDFIYISVKTVKGGKKVSDFIYNHSWLNM